MTIKKKMKDMLISHGAWDNEADAILAIAQGEKQNEPMQGRWEDEVSYYLPSFLTVAWMSVRQTAIKYFEENNPQHFALALLKSA